jgi:hypothetical protein
MSDIKHKYSFTAFFEDGNQITMDKDAEQDDDYARLTEQGSRFTDVKTYEKTSKLISFVVHNESTVIGVDLRDGHFELNGFPIFQHRPNLKTENYKDFRIIHYRTVQRVMNQQTGTQISGEVLAYGLGWQVTHNGENVKRIMYF